MVKPVLGQGEAERVRHLDRRLSLCPCVGHGEGLGDAVGRVEQVAALSPSGLGTGRKRRRWCHRRGPPIRRRPTVECEDEAKNRKGHRGMVHFPLASHSLGLRGPARSAPAGVRHGCLRDMTHKRRGPCDASSAITASPLTSLSVKALDLKRLRPAFSLQCPCSYESSGHLQWNVPRRIYQSRTRR